MIDYNYRCCTESSRIWSRSLVTATTSVFRRFPSIAFTYLRNFKSPPTTELTTELLPLQVKTLHGTQIQQSHIAI